MGYSQGQWYLDRKGTEAMTMSGESGMPREPAGTAVSRRVFLARTVAVAGTTAVARAFGASEEAPIRVGIVGCGRRGLGAARDCVEAGAGAVRIVALADVFPDAMAAAKEKLAALGQAYQVADSACYVGFDAYRHLVQLDLDLVILAAPPAFRPEHLRAALEAGKHVFMEKPAAVDVTGVRSVLDSAVLAEQKRLCVVAGTQRRYQPEYRALIARLQEGAIGRILSAYCYWVGDYDYYTPVPRQPEWSDLEYQLRNWNYYTWLSGDHIVEQHVHNLDVVNWALQAHPIKAVAMGGRQQRVGPEFGYIWDHFSVEYEYPNGVRVESWCRQNKDTYHRVGEYFVGTEGTADVKSGIQAKQSWRFSGASANPYVEEHRHLIEAIRTGKPINDAGAVAESTLTAILGRVAAYTGQEVTWDWLLHESKEDLVPKTLAWGPMPVPPVPVPGVTPLV